MVTIVRSDRFLGGNKMGLDTSRATPLPYSPNRAITYLGSWLGPLIAGSLYGLLLAGPGAGLGFAMTDKVLALSVLGAAATGRISWLLFAMGASLNGIAWGRRVIDLGFGHMQLTEYMALGMAVNVILHFITHPVSMPRQMKKLFLFAFLPALAFALAASIGGWMNGNPEFASPLRACLVIVGLPYAFLNIRNLDRAKRVFFGIVYLAVMAYIARFVLPFAGIVPEGLGSFLLAAPVISILLLPKVAPVTRICMILAVLLLALTGLTLTVFLSVALAVALYFVYHTRARSIRQLALFCLIISVSVMTLVGVSVLRDELVLGPGATMMKLDPGLHREGILAFPLDFIRFKVYDRLVLWIPAVREIANSPFRLDAGRTLWVYRLAGEGEKRPWPIHVHNTFIEIARQFSLPGSIFFNGLILVVLVTLYRSLRRGTRRDAYLVAWSLFGLSFLPGFVFGFFPVAGEIGVYFWLACGVIYNHSRLSTSEDKLRVN